MKNALITALVTASLAACATAPRHSEQIEQARAEIAVLSQSPLAQQAAASDLQAAQSNLQEAQAALEQRQPESVVDHYAYLAQRHAQAGEARVQAAQARQDLARTQSERNRILLAARGRETANTKAQLADAQQQLADLKAKQTERGTVVTLGDVLFDTAAATLKPGADLTVGRLADYLKAHPDTHILIEGHTDSRGSEEYNDALSERRAQSVASALDARGVSPDVIQTRGLGKAYPVASNETAEGRQQNRRVEIVFSNAQGRFAEGSDNGALRR